MLADAVDLQTGEIPCARSVYVIDAHQVLHIGLGVRRADNDPAVDGNLTGGFGPFHRKRGWAVTVEQEPVLGFCYEALIESLYRSHNGALPSNPE